MEISNKCNDLKIYHHKTYLKNMVSSKLISFQRVRKPKHKKLNLKSSMDSFSCQDAWLLVHRT